MATINLGAIKFNWKGAYNSSTSYAVDDVVSSGGNSYVCIQAHSNQAVGNATAYWNIMSSAGTNGTNGTDLTSTLTTQGDILYRDGSGLQRLPKGTAGQVLQMNSGATAPEYADASGGLIQKTYAETTQEVSTTSTSFVVTSLVNSITPTSASNKIWLTGMLGGMFQTGGGSLHLAIYRQINGGGYSQWRLLESGWFLYSADTGGEHSLNLYDTTHNTTNQIDYKVYIKSEGGTTVRVGGSSAYQTMSLLEIGV